ncbi:hypothetical protein D1841_13450 [Neglecta sp. X4]|nr:hypothetical protein [Neglectibacter sp. 59]NBJ74252.1 hypothetical protein [Neglectibacter sp. X4]NCE82408.1 hypothetical protein [Neglectibacter sp. X58]
MKRIYNKWQGYSLADCDCQYCLYYGGKKKGERFCLSEKCVCLEEICEAIGRESGERKDNGSQDQ